MIGDISYENSELLMPFSEIGKHFVEQDFIMSHRHSCPSLSDFNTTTIKVCPSYRVLDVDVNREPVALYQVILLFCYLAYTIFFLVIFGILTVQVDPYNKKNFSAKIRMKIWSAQI
jgi:hypothetical protein